MIIHITPLTQLVSTLFLTLRNNFVYSENYEYVIHSGNPERLSEIFSKNQNVKWVYVEFEKVVFRKGMV